MIFKPNCIFLQEIKLKSESVKLKGFDLFYNLRTQNDGGGLLTAIDSELSPFEVPIGNKNIEILSIEMTVGEIKIRTINAYGPQETDTKEKIDEFWQELEMHIVDAKTEDCGILIEMDANAKLGSEIILNDPNNMSNNGKILLGLMNRQHLVCLNSHQSCEGTITRFRSSKNGTEQAVLDYVLVCEKLLPYFQKMNIDEKRAYTLTKYASKKGKRVMKESDHNVITVEFSLRVHKAPPCPRREFFDFRNNDSLNTFKLLSEDCLELRECWDEALEPEVKSKKFLKCLNNLFHRSFKKIRICPGKGPNFKNNKEVAKWLSLKTRLLTAKATTSCPQYYNALQRQIIFVEKEISDLISSHNSDAIYSQLATIDSLDGGFNQQGMWLVKKKIFPKPKSTPTLKLDELGNRICGKSALKQLYLRTYRARLEHRQINERYLPLRKLKEELWNLRYLKLKCKSSSPWSMQELVLATKTLKNNKSRDPLGMIAEVFKPEVTGNHMKESLLNFLNMILETFFLPEELLLSDITSIWKRKGCKSDLSNDRGIFVLSILRKILDKILYNHFYPNLDRAMSDSNIGARRKKNVRNHLFIVYGIINSVLREKKESIDIIIYDIVQAFDSLWLQDCMNDIYDLLPQNYHDKKLALIYELNKSNLVAVNTPIGQTERIVIPEIVQQGGSWGPIECSVSIDKIGRDCTKNKKHTYFYKNNTAVVPLAMVDDLLAIAKCGIESIAINTYIVTHIEMKKLRLHTPDLSGKSKCHRLHVGRDSGLCPKLYVHGSELKSADHDVYLGDIISRDGKNKLNIADRVSKGKGKIAEIICMTEKLSLGKHFFKIAVLLRETLFLSSILFNSEVWYGVTSSEINQLESIDRLLLRRLCGLPNSTPVAALYLETGCMRIGTIMKARRLNYLYYLAKLSKVEMLSKFFWCQWDDCKESDWCYQVKRDLVEFRLPHDINQITSNYQ